MQGLVNQQFRKGQDALALRYGFSDFVECALSLVPSPKPKRQRSPDPDHQWPLEHFVVLLRLEGAQTVDTCK